MAARLRTERGGCSVQKCVVVADESHVTALGISDGRVWWKKPLSAGPVLWGMAVHRAGRVIVALKDGRIICFRRVVKFV